MLSGNERESVLIRVQEVRMKAILTGILVFVKPLQEVFLS